MADGVLVSIVTPTFRRPERVLEAARSVAAMTVDVAFEWVAVDNDPAGSALGALQAFAATARFPVKVVHEPHAGVASARNAGLRVAQGQFIAFLDDDEVAPAEWLSELLAAQRRLKADVVFGPVLTKFRETPEEHADFLSHFFARDPGHAEGLIAKPYGCGCSLIRTAALPSAEPFAMERNQIGGEDDLLFHHMAERGATFGWAPKAYVFETPEPERVNLAYALRRSFAYGQGPCTSNWARVKPNYPAIAFWMGVGVAQTLVYGLLSLAVFLVRSRNRAFVYQRLVGGVGKVLWFPALKPRFYGASLIQRTPVDLVRSSP
jgi:glycosyltransferase involved in cell wall biosynthesis